MKMRQNINCVLNHPMYKLTNDICRYEISTTFAYFKNFLIVIIMKDTIHLIWTG